MRLITALIFTILLTQPAIAGEKHGIERYTCKILSGSKLIDAGPVKNAESCRKFCTGISKDKGLDEVTCHLSKEEEIDLTSGKCEVQDKKGEFIDSENFETLIECRLFCISVIQDKGLKRAKCLLNSKIL